jgi:hypothetical protein
MTEFNVYNDFIRDEKFENLPSLKIEDSSQDFFIQWSDGNRLDKLAYKYYNNASLGKLILLANPSYVHENDINGGDFIRIPFPKDSFFIRIQKAIENAKKF